jgi:hypothetical protein
MGCRELGNEPSGSIKGGDFHDYTEAMEGRSMENPPPYLLWALIQPSSAYFPIYPCSCLAIILFTGMLACVITLANDKCCGLVDTGQ